MRVHLLVAVAACGAWCAATAGIAQAQSTRVDVGPGGVRVDAGGTHVEAGLPGMRGMQGKIARARDLTGLTVYNSSNEDLGKIEDVVIDPDAGRIRYAVLSFGGWLGMGDKYFAIPWQRLSFISKGETRFGTEKEDHVVLNVSKETLKNAPGFNKDNWPNFADQNWRQIIEKHYATQRQASGERNPQR